MIDFDLFGGSATQDPWALLETNGLDAQKFADEQLQLKLELARMVRAVAATEAGKYVLNWLTQTYVIRAHFSPDLNASMEQVAMRGVYHTAQADLVLTLLGLAKFMPAPTKPSADNGPEQSDAARKSNTTGKRRAARKPNAAR